MNQLPTYKPGDGAAQWRRVFLAHLFRRPTVREVVVPFTGGLLIAVILGWLA